MKAIKATNAKIANLVRLSNSAQVLVSVKIKPDWHTLQELALEQEEHPALQATQTSERRKNPLLQLHASFVDDATKLAPQILQKVKL